MISNDENEAVICLEYYSWDYDTVKARFNSSETAVL